MVPAFGDHLLKENVQVVVIEFALLEFRSVTQGSQSRTRYASFLQLGSAASNIDHGVILVAREYRYLHTLCSITSLVLAPMLLVTLLGCHCLINLPLEDIITLLPI